MVEQTDAWIRSHEQLRFRLAGGLLSITLSMGLATEVAATPLPVTSPEISTAGVVI
jgi:hypothetical protein